MQIRAGGTRVGRNGGRSIVEKWAGGRFFGLCLDWLLDDEFEGVGDLGLIVESAFEEGIVAFLVHVGEIAVGAGNSGSIVLIGNELRFDDKGLIDARS